MSKRILYPFKVDYRNKETFVAASALAERLRAELIFFTVLPETATDPQLDEAYLHLLDLNGHYQVERNHWRKPSFSSRKIFKKGTILQALTEFMQKTEIDFVVCQPHYLTETQLQQISAQTPFEPVLLTLRRPG